MEISLDLVTEAARRRLAAVSPEVAGYIVLLATRELEARLFRVSAANFALSETGEVRARPEGCMSESEVEAALRELLGSLLSLSPSPSPSVVAVAEREASTGLRGLSAELTAALIPINHAAAQRALARLFRETRRARDAVQLADADLDIDVEVEAAPPAPSDVPPSAPPGSPGSVAVSGAIAPPPSTELDEPAPPAEDVEQRVADAVPGVPYVPERIATALEIDVVGVDVRSDVDALIAAFLSHTRSEPALTLALRRLVGLAPRLELATS